MIIYNGSLVRDDRRDFPALNRSFRYGDGLFETIRVYRGRELFLADHLDRLREGMMLLGFQVSWSEWSSEIRQSVNALLDVQEIAGPGRLRLHVWRQGEGAYAPQQDEVEYLIEYRALDHEWFQEPRTVTCSDYHGVTIYPNALSRIKTASALPYVLAARQARDTGTDEALMFNHRKEIAEASAANIFVFRRQKLFTPPITSGCLDGLMRKHVLDIAGMLHLYVEERPLKRRDIQSADAVFLTNSIRGIQPVSAYHHCQWGKKDWRHVSLLQKGLLDLVENHISA